MANLFFFMVALAPVAAGVTAGVLGTPRFCVAVSPSKNALRLALGSILGDGVTQGASCSSKLNRSLMGLLGGS